MQPKIKNLFIYFLPWRCGYSRIAQTKRQRTKTFGLYSNSRATSLARLFFYVLLQNFLSAVPFSLTLAIPFNPYLPPAHFLILKKLKGSLTPPLGYALLPLPLSANKKFLEVYSNAQLLSKSLQRFIGNHLFR